MRFREVSKKREVGFNLLCRLIPRTCLQKGRRTYVEIMRRFSDFTKSLATFITKITESPEDYVRETLGLTQPIKLN
jgi:hypothetical protein